MFPTQKEMQGGHVSARSGTWERCKNQEGPQSQEEKGTSPEVDPPPPSAWQRGGGKRDASSSLPDLALGARKSSPTTSPPEPNLQWSPPCPPCRSRPASCPGSGGAASCPPSRARAPPILPRHRSRPVTQAEATGFRVETVRLRTLQLLPTPRLAPPRPETRPRVPPRTGAGGSTVFLRKQQAGGGLALPFLTVAELHNGSKMCFVEAKQLSSQSPPKHVHAKVNLLVLNGVFSLITLLTWE